MSRSAVYAALTTDARLTELGIGADNVYPNYTLDTPPDRFNPFLILRWESVESRGPHRRGPQTLTIWAHIPKQRSMDHADLDLILERVEELLCSMYNAKGVDGYVVSDIRYTGASGDLLDVGYDTIVRNAAFEVLSSKRAG